MAVGDFTPYSTVAPFFGATLPQWVPEEDRERIASYRVYEEIYWNHPETFKLVTRGANNLPIYVPSGKIVVETAHRYIGTRGTFSVTPEVGTPAEIALAQQAFTDLFRRERWNSRYSGNKRFGLIRGDWVFHITADDTKVPGTRISLRTTDPAAYFPVPDPDNLDRILKVHLAEQFVDSDKKVYVRRQTYERDDSGTIISSEGVYEVKGWETLTAKLVRVIRPPTALPPQITAFPVYHIRNFDEPGNPFGSSELRGVESVLNGINQGLSDEDMSLALEGLGVYKNGGGRPYDDDGNPINWIIGPGRVMEDETFERVPGIGSVQPYQDHIGMLKEFLYESAAAGDAARGKVDVTIAESGVALQMQLAPTLAKAGEKNNEIKDTLTQMFYDLKFWFQAYEGFQFPDAEILPVFGSPLPTNVNEVLQQVSLMMSTDPPLMSATTGREILAEAGVRFAPDELTRITQEQQLAQEIAAAADPFAQRANAELENQPPEDQPPRPDGGG